ncbi:DNA topoisomerase 3 [Thioalkalivibrio sp. ALgr3]|uniref:DNA topoisomerase 3 n=1 Tax=Thioalkalivibrio sp. ALgr3 TaxID=1239292 RepID=UPI000370CEBD|nr:DNA topoisomerase 3 [Thioalkalivibrio sp. ALgr3]
MEKLFIAEKPSLGRAIAENLPGPKKNGEGYIQAGNDVVTWCFGHILEMPYPEAYNPEWKSWDLKHLPIIPPRWKLEPKRDSKDQLKTIKTLLAQASTVVNAGDPDREGQMLVDEVLEYLGNDRPTKRLLLSATDPATVKRELGRMQPNDRFRGLYQAGLGRARADWLVGMNLSRAITKTLSREHMISIGRVQTPTLALVARRCDLIENFEPRDFFDIEATVHESSRDPADDSTPRLTLAFSPQKDEDRLWDQAEAKSIAKALKNREGALSKMTERKKERPPRLFTLPELQKFASKNLKLSASKTLAVAQELYEKKLTTYPRTECPYLPKEQEADVPDILDAIGQAADESLVNARARLQNPEARPSVFNTAKVEEHHAIIPTRNPLPEGLSDQAVALYKAIAMRYLLMLAPDRVYDETLYTAVWDERTYKAKGQVTVSPGWTTIAGKAANDKALPDLPDGARVTVADAKPRKRTTRPPDYYTEGTLIEDMGSVAKYVQNDKLKAVLKENSGIGTAATQAQTIETLKSRGYITLDRGKLKVSELGRSIAHNLHPLLVNPDLTAKWEMDLKRIADGDMELSEFEGNIHRFLDYILKWAKDRQGEVEIAGEPAKTKGRGPKKGGGKRRKAA